MQLFCISHMVHSLLLKNEFLSGRFQRAVVLVLYGKKWYHSQLTFSWCFPTKYDEPDLILLTQSRGRDNISSRVILWNPNIAEWNLILPPLLPFWLGGNIHVRKYNSFLSQVWTGPSISVSHFIGVCFTLDRKMIISYPNYGTDSSPGAWKANSRSECIIKKLAYF